MKPTMVINIRIAVVYRGGGGDRMKGRRQEGIFLGEGNFFILIWMLAAQVHILAKIHETLDLNLFIL